MNCIHASRKNSQGGVKLANPQIHQIFVGIDIGYRTHVVCACPGALFNTKRYPNGWKRAKTLHFPSDTRGFRELQRHLDKLSTNPADFLMLCEPTGGHYGLALQMYLLEKGYTVLQVENSAVTEYREKIYGSDTKTDDMDARLMARMGFLHELVGEEFSIQPVRLLEPDTAIMRVMFRDHMKLGKDIHRLRSQLHQMVAATFPELKTFFTDTVTGHAARNLLKRYPTPQELKEAAVAEIAQVLAASKAFNHAKRADQLLALAQTSVGLRIESHHRWRQEWILNQLDVLEKAQEDLKAQLSRLVATHPYTPIIESLPVKSTIWTATLIGVIGNIDRFHNYRQFRSYMGWFPKVKQSGTSLNTSQLAPDGVRLGRHVFGLMAMTLMSPNVPETPFRIHYERLLVRGMKPLTAIGNVAGKLTAVLYSCLKTGTPYDQTKHRQELGLPDGQELQAKPPAKTPASQLPTVDH